MHCPKLQPSGWNIEDVSEARRKEERDCPWRKAAISSALLQAGVRPPDGRRTPCSPCGPSDLSLPFPPSHSFSLSFSLSFNPGKMKDAVKQIESVEEKGWRKGAGWETGQLVGPLPEQRSRLRARPRTGPLGWEKERRTAPLLCARYYSLRTGRAEFDAERSRDRKVETRNAPRALRHNLPNGAVPHAFNNRRVTDVFFAAPICRMLPLGEEWYSGCVHAASACAGKSRLIYQHANPLTFYTFSYYAPRTRLRLISRGSPRVSFRSSNFKRYFLAFLDTWQHDLSKDVHFQKRFKSIFNHLFFVNWNVACV